VNPLALFDKMQKHSSLSLWDYCNVDLEHATELEEFQNELNRPPQHPENRVAGNIPAIASSSSGKGTSSSLPESSDQITLSSIQSYLEESDISCSTAEELIDNLVNTVHNVKSSYYDVTGRTNSLMAKCESLLDEQHNLMNTVEILRETLKPFEDIEEISQTLGIPYESIANGSIGSGNALITSSSGRVAAFASSFLSASGKHYISSSSSSGGSTTSNVTTNLDPRSPEFKELLTKLSNAILFLQSHQEILECSKYTIWLEKLQIRAISLIGRAMRELIDKVAQQCREIIQTKASAPSSSSAASGKGDGSSSSSSSAAVYRIFSEDQPLESLPIYQKFRGLSFRMKELVTVLLKGNLTNLTSSSSSSSNPSAADDNADINEIVIRKKALNQSLLKHDYTILAEVKKGYLLIRIELLSPFLQEAFLVSLSQSYSSVASSVASSASSISSSGSGTNFSTLLEDKRLLTSHQQRGIAENKGPETSSPASSSSSSLLHLSLSTVIRYCFSTLLRMTQLEYQLFDSLFNIEHMKELLSPSTSSFLNSSSSYSVASTPRTPANSSSFSFKGTSTSGKNNSSNTTTGALSKQDQFAADLLRIFEFLSNSTRDFLRPLIIKESSVDELCRVISTLSEDIRSQIMILQLPMILIKQLIIGLDNTMNDTKERLIYCSELKLRKEIQFYEPLPSSLNYPEILEVFYNHQSSQALTRPGPTSNQSPLPSSTSSSSSSSLGIHDIYDTWYPPMRITLALLSKLFGIIDRIIFEDFARRCIEVCILILIQGSETMKRSQKGSNAMIHGDFFLVRHLLILREQLIPFELRLITSEKELDFSNTRSAFTSLLALPSSSSSSSATFTQQNSLLPPSSSSASDTTALQRIDPRSATNPSTSSSTSSSSALSMTTSHILNNLLFRFDENNLLYQFTNKGIPLMKETQYDIKKELDNSLKKACITLKVTVVKFLLGPLDNLLAKIVAFIGEIPYHHSNQLLVVSSPAGQQQLGQLGDGSSKSNKGNVNVPSLSTEHIQLLKGQSFIRYDRLKECLEQVQHLLIQRMPDLKIMMKVRYFVHSLRRVCSSFFFLLLCFPFSLALC
jgi:hypothetical protein